MKSKWRKSIVTLLLVGTMIGSASALSYAAGFWNHTPYTLQFGFTPENCPWVLRWVCGDVYVVPPAENGRPGSMSSNNTAGTVEIGGDLSNLLTAKNGNIYYSFERRVFEVGKQDAIEFSLEGNVLKMTIYRRDTGQMESEELKLANM